MGKPDETDGLFEEGFEAILCDHDWQFVDDSFDHEFGTETVHYERCSLCDEERDYEPDDDYPED